MKALIKEETSTPHNKPLQHNFIQIYGSRNHTYNVTCLKPFFFFSISHLFGGTSFSMAPHAHNNIKEHNMQLSY